MKTEKELNTTAELQEEEEEAFRKKANHYLVCFIDSCPLHGQCLRWLTGQYINPKLPAYNAINPRNPENGCDHCPMFRKKQRVMMKRGMTNLYHEMPGYMEHQIRHSLISQWGRRNYFEMRRGDRLITPEQQQDVLNTCREFGWKGPIVFDGEQEDWYW